jgi:PKHD-type hydroxylase
MATTDPNLTGVVASGRGAFSDIELDSIEKLGESLALERATLGAYGNVEQRKRITRVAALIQNPDTQWIYDRLIRVVGVLNQRYRFDLVAIQESAQFMVYRDAEGGHFDWHKDQGPSVKRQLSMTLQLSDPAGYQGCDLEFKHGDQAMTAPRERGTLIAFPSYLMHRVSPITAGTRKSLVVWVA